ncbi:hypothetical protein MYXO_01184 [Myxococcaceae bacterium]|jgi:uncharacterized membrane protein|nr:hypothetical protein MYXO_01184 [Myxococcaceae bacterium]
MRPGEAFQSMQQFLRRNFVAGVLSVLPLLITIWILRWLIDLLESGVRLLPPALRPENLLPFYVPGLGALVTLAAVVALGFAMTTLVSHRITRWVNGLLLRIPVFRGIYAAVKRLVEAIMLPQHQSFRRVVLIEYPRKGIYAVGLVTGVTEGEVQERTSARVVNVFVPTTPNPTSGYYVLAPESELIPLSMSVEDAFKLVMSGGIVTPEHPDGRVENPRAGAAPASSAGARGPE